MLVEREKTIRITMQNEDGSYREYAHVIENKTHKGKSISSYDGLREETNVLNRVACLAASFLFHIWFLKFLTANKFDAVFSKIIFYYKYIMSKELDESFITENSFEIMSLGFGLILFQGVSGLGSDCIEEKIKKIKKLNFSIVIRELAIIHLILLIARFTYPLLINMLSKVSKVFNYEISQFVLAEGII